MAWWCLRVSQRSTSLLLEYEINSLIENSNRENYNTILSTTLALNNLEASVSSFQLSMKPFKGLYSTVVKFTNLMRNTIKNLMSHFQYLSTLTGKLETWSVSGGILGMELQLTFRP